MEYNFDEIIDRKGTDAVKIEGLLSNWGRTDFITDVGSRYGFPYSRIYNQRYTGTL